MVLAGEEFWCSHIIHMSQRIGTLPYLEEVVLFVKISPGSCMMGNFHDVLSSAVFLESPFSNYSFRNYASE